MRTKTVPVVIGALGTIKMGLDQNLQLLSAHLLAEELQTIALMSTAHVIRKVLGKNRFDVLLKSGLTTRPPTNN